MVDICKKLRRELGLMTNGVKSQSEQEAHICQRYKEKISIQALPVSFHRSAVIRWLVSSPQLIFSAFLVPFKCQTY